MIVDQAGDDVALHLTVVPDGGVAPDETTTVTVEARHDDGTVKALAAHPDAERRVWSALFRDVTPGVWQVVWTVRGTGSGVTTYPLAVGPTAEPAGRTYATTADLARYLGRPPDPGAARLLARATEWVDRLCVTACYRVEGPDSMPVSPLIAAALRDAVCGYVEAWEIEGDDTGGAAPGDEWSSVAIGSVRLSGARPGGSISTGRVPPPPPTTVAALRRVGLLSHAPRWC